MLYVFVIGDYVYMHVYIIYVCEIHTHTLIYNLLLSFYLFGYIINTYCYKNNESEYKTTTRNIKKVGKVLSFDI